MKKKIFLTIAMVAVLVVSFGIAACKSESAVGSLSNVGNESFDGQISEQSYESTEAAAKAFLINELDGKTTKTNFVSYDKKKDVPREEIEKLPLGDLKASDVTSAEEGTITYDLTVTGNAYAAKDAGNERTQTVYILDVGGTYYYFVPEARNGEMISNSYYKDFWDINHYRNCTMSSVIEMKLNAKQGSVSVDVSVKTNIELKITESSLYFKSDYTIGASGYGAEEIAAALAGSSAALKKMEIYLVEKDGNLLACMKSGENWTVKNSPYDSCEDFFMENNQQPEFLDYTYFVKTDTGFKVDPQKVDLYIAQYNPIFAQMLGSCNMNTEYVVENKRMTSVVTEITGSLTQSGVTTTVSASGKTEYKDYDKTGITIPEDLTKQIDALD